MGVALIGTGQWGANHVRVLTELKAPLELIVDKNQDTLKKLSSQYDVPVSTNFNEAFKRRDIDSIFIATPASTHYSIARQAILADKDVFVEKPLCTNSRDAKELVELAKKKNKVLMVGHIFRFNPAVIKIKELIEKNTFGEIYFLNSSRIGLRTPRTDCGVILDFAVHDFDILSFILNKEYPDEITAVGNSYLQHGFEDVGFITARFGNIIANITVSWLTPNKVRELWVVGKDKSASLDYTTQDLQIYDIGVVPSYDSFGDFRLITREGNISRSPVKTQEPMSIEDAHFLECVEKRTTPIADGNVGLRVIQMVEATLASIREKRTVEMRRFI